jgi:glycosyltransferase involved in cell wall biosynthesis
MKKILYVSANGFIGGAEKFLINIASIHAETKDSVHFLLFDHGPLEDELKKIGVPVSVLKNKFRVRNVFKFISAVSEIRHFLKKHNFSTIHSTMAYSQFVMGLATMFSRVKRVWFQHGPVGGMFDYLASFFSVDILLFSSHFLMEKHYSSYVLRKAICGRKVIPLPVNVKPPKLTEAFALRKALNLEGVYVLGMIGRITRGKGYDLALKSFLGLDLPDSKLLILGSANSADDKKYLEELKKYTADHNANEKIVFVSHQSNVAVYYKIFNLYLNPVTIDEGFGLSVAEAMKSGVPVISSPYGGLSEFVKVNETAEIIMARNNDAVESLKELILKVKADELYSKRLSKNARDLIESRFSSSQTYVAITDVYQYLDSIE